jgi:hypothetical protein
MATVTGVGVAVAASAGVAGAAAGAHAVNNNPIKPKLPKIIIRMVLIS